VGLANLNLVHSSPDKRMQVQKAMSLTFSSISKSTGSCMLNNDGKFLGTNDVANSEAQSISMLPPTIQAVPVVLVPLKPKYQDEDPKYFYTLLCHP
jgi:hypothetical protein